RQRASPAPSRPTGTPGPKALSLSPAFVAGVRGQRLSVTASSQPHTRSGLHLIRQLRHLPLLVIPI
ncbi:hypothetical protein MUK42_30044, partial [Musa troglodytarum]